jgi:hypothetical protein
MIWSAFFTRKRGFTDAPRYYISTLVHAASLSTLSYLHLGERRAIDELELRRLFDREIGWLRSFQDLVHMHESAC